MLTELTDKHRSFLRTIAKNLNNQPAILAYADFLQDDGNPGHLIVQSYAPVDWPQMFDRWAEMYGKTVALGAKKADWTKWWTWSYRHRLPWLPGWVDMGQCTGAFNPRSRCKFILNEYADGRVHEYEG